MITVVVLSASPDLNKSLDFVRAKCVIETTLKNYAKLTDVPQSLF